MVCVAHTLSGPRHCEQAKFQVGFLWGLLFVLFGQRHAQLPTHSGAYTRVTHRQTTHVRSNATGTKRIHGARLSTRTHCAVVRETIDRYRHQSLVTISRHMTSLPSALERTAVAVTLPCTGTLLMCSGSWIVVGIGFNGRRDRTRLRLASHKPTRTIDYTPAMPKPMTHAQTTAIP